MSTSDQVLAYGPPPLTQYAADCALDVIDFMAAVVRGVDLIDVTEKMRQIWRNYLAQYYPMLAPADRVWFANAPATLAQINANWPQMPAYAQEMWRQTWAASLPAILQFIEPVLQAAQEQEAISAVSQLYQQSSTVANPAPGQVVDSAEAVQRQVADNLAAFNNRMSYLTTNMMHAMDGAPRPPKTPRR